MALTKGRTAITQLTATGNSSDLDVSDAYKADLGIKHVNGTGTITAGAQIHVRWKPSGGSQWYVLASILCSLTASDEQTFSVRIPDAAASVDLDYTAPTGSTGHTLDAEVGETTAV